MRVSDILVFPFFEFNDLLYFYLFFGHKKLTTEFLKNNFKTLL